MKLKKETLVPDDQCLLQRVIDPVRVDRIEYIFVTQQPIVDIIGI